MFTDTLHVSVTSFIKSHERPANVRPPIDLILSSYKQSSIAHERIPDTRSSAKITDEDVKTEQYI